MRNDTLIKVTCVTNGDNKDEFHFDYYNKEGALVGTVAVNESGRLGWSIWDSSYQENILNNASYILGKPVENTIEYIQEAKENDPIRWDRAQEFIDYRSLVVNYQEKFGFNNGARRK